MHIAHESGVDDIETVGRRRTGRPSRATSTTRDAARRGDADLFQNNAESFVRIIRSKEPRARRGAFVDEHGDSYKLVAGRTRGRSIGGHYGIHASQEEWRFKDDGVI